MKKLKSFIKKEIINERLTSAMFKRMAGLVNVAYLKSFQIYASDIIEDLENEGFDKNDIYDFLIEKIKIL